MTTHAGENALRPEDPRELGSYRLLGRLGRGGMGTVFLGEDGSGHRVAVKVINRELAGEASFRDRFRREVTAARQVRRFCTAPVIDAELERDPLWVVTEYIEGPSLERAVAERGPLPGSDLEGIAVGVATALAAIHGAGIVHRDLKPANVLLSSTGPRVIDFGIARALDAADGPTRTGQFVGTPNYLPPELLRGEPVTPASDVFSWGCVVAYAGTGGAPFAGSTVPEIFYRVAHEEPSLERLDPGLRDVVRAALDKDPRNRPSVQDLLARLVGHARPDPARLAETVQASWHGTAPGAAAPGAASPHPGGQLPGTPHPGAQHPGTQDPGTQDPGSPGAGPPPAGPTTTLGGDATRSDRPVRPARRGSPRRPLIVGAAALAAVVAAGVGAYALLRPDGPPGDTTSFYAIDFSSGAGGWYGGDYTGTGQGAEAGHYRVDLEGTSTSGLNITSSPIDTDERTLPGRQLVSAKATATSGPGYGQYGLFCLGSQSTGEESGYQFLVRKDGKGSLIRKMSKEIGTKELATSDGAGGFKEGKANLLQIACEKKGKQVELRFWVNGSLAASATDTDKIVPDRNSGVVLTRVSRAEQTLTVNYDDFEIAEIKG